MGGSSFELILQEIQQHQHLMDRLEQENRELRRQLTDLREGRGIFVDICGQRFPLTIDTTALAYPSIPAPAPQRIPEVQEVLPVSGEVPTAEAEVKLAATTITLPELMDVSAQLEDIPALSPLGKDELEEKTGQAKVTTFLEEAMIDEFAAASTTPMAVWKGPAKQQETIDEAEKAALRRQLIGSFLLE